MAKSSSGQINKHFFAEQYPLIILRLSGGLGNQMFQYAFGIAVARKLGKTLKIDISDHTLNIHNGYELNLIFNIPTLVADAKEVSTILGIERSKLVRKVYTLPLIQKFVKSKTIRERCYSYYDVFNELSDNRYLIGYWQSYKYFDHIKNEVKNLFKFKEPLDKKNCEILDIILKTNSVSIHIRRNDYITNKNANAAHGVCTIDYYIKSIEYIASKVESPNFFIFSDDHDWTKKNVIINYPCYFIDWNNGKNSYLDMWLMSNCSHNIIANSSFSWWGAWLNSRPDKIVVAPRKWFNEKKSTQDLLPTTWNVF